MIMMKGNIIGDVLLNISNNNSRDLKQDNQENNAVKN
jgi:hypothetical protein